MVCFVANLFQHVLSLSCCYVFCSRIVVMGSYVVRIRLVSSWVFELAVQMIKFDPT